ncbi:hypothetical protein AVEN_45850-1 [Araneus ventricosus]|uniref:Uncharacterized protein n=1 Tax=Araneus ventricosus TaxID=182803 RepID=A0A4Y2JS21_ARAVE|nr:hypothetical protein AVEN_45850-1 [Araneus ventricosus]
MAAPQIPSPDNPTMAATQLYQFKVYDTLHSTKSMTHFHSANPARASAENNRGSNLRICTQHTEVQLSLPCSSDNIKQAGDCSCSAPSYFDVYKPISTSGHWEFLFSSG